MPTKAIARITGIIAVVPLLVVLFLPEQGKHFRDRHHVLELFGPSAAPSE
jgi:hypothetical protein